MASAIGVKLLSSNTPTAIRPAFVLSQESLELFTVVICAMIFLFKIIIE